MTFSKGCCPILILLVGSAVPLGAQVFENDVQPIFASHCQACHSGAQAAAGVDLTSYAAVLGGGAKGAVVVKGAAEKSILFNKVSSRAMPPPKRGKPLTEQQITVIQKWIDDGLASTTASASPAAAVAPP